MKIQEPEQNYITGWVKLFRSLENHWLWTNEKYLKCWLWMIFRANHKDNKVLIGASFENVQRGQFITSLNKISEASNMTIQSTRTFLDLLLNDKMIEKTSTNKLTKITICNYAIYQSEQQSNNKPATNQQQTNNKPATTDKNEKNKKNEKNDKNKDLIISKIQDEFYQSLKQFYPEFKKETLREFYDYWSEPNKSKTKIKWQIEKTWDTHKRLLRWVKNDFTKKGNPESKPVPKTIFRDKNDW